MPHEPKHSPPPTRFGPGVTQAKAVAAAAGGPPPPPTRFGPGVTQAKVAVVAAGGPPPPPTRFGPGATQAKAAVGGFPVSPLVRGTIQRMEGSKEGTIASIRGLYKEIMKYGRDSAIEQYILPTLEKRDVNNLTQIKVLLQKNLQEKRSAEEKEAMLSLKQGVDEGMDHYLVGGKLYYVVALSTCQALAHLGEDCPDYKFYLSAMLNGEIGKFSKGDDGIKETNTKGVYEIKVAQHKGNLLDTQWSPVGTLSKVDNLPGEYTFAIDFTSGGSRTHKGGFSNVKKL